MEDLKGYPINYNHYYTNTIKHRRETRRREALEQSIMQASSVPEGATLDSTPPPVVNIEQHIASLSKKEKADMEPFSCGESLDCSVAIYKVQQKYFIANITTQVIERHIVRGLEKIFFPVVVNAMSDIEVEAIDSEPSSTKYQSDHIEDRMRILQDGERIFRGVLG